MDKMVIPRASSDGERAGMSDDDTVFPNGGNATGQNGGSKTHASPASTTTSPTRPKKKGRSASIVDGKTDGGRAVNSEDDEETEEDVEEEEEDEDEEMKDDTADEEEDDPDDEDEDEDDEDEDEEQSNGSAELTKIELSDPSSMLRMIQSLPDKEARRHEQFRRSHFDRGAIKRIVARTIQASMGSDKKVPAVTQVMAIVMAGMTKVFVGELTTEARRIMDKNGETGPITKRHLREAYRKYYKRRPLARGRNLCRLLR